ncbi:dynamin [Virgisporangium aliadipatigenens]|uniref:Dynamin n=1 Tax=Virgisporangium aliadipatigenens TaxID=741659 RepID=A0A8J3YFC7_9ACTN|nr:dynamin family protein [Virgisporangium aliadipatigenens]GIJ43233.1 dynamin [Virgisporangium aliadipatigenens]
MTDPSSPAQQRAGRSAAVARAVLDLAEARRLSGQAGRIDLMTRIDEATARLGSDDVPVAVVGEFKQGKSTLVNALLRTEVCPVDSDIVTAVPTVVRWGKPPSVTARLENDDEVAVPFKRLHDYVAERTGDEVPVRAVEVRLDRQLLRGGLSFVDTPGVGGLDSAHGNLTLGALTLARAALFVTDAAQELAGPELEFLNKTAARCEHVIIVVTKTDLYPEWRRIVRLNQTHLAQAGLQVPMVPVSSFLRLRAAARNSDALNAESGFPRLLTMLRRDILAEADTLAARAAGQEVAFVLSQLREQVGAARAAGHDPRTGWAIADQVAEKSRRSQALAASGAGWQTVLNDGIQDLSADIDHDLRERLRGLLRRGEALLDEDDPKNNWRDFSAWVTREATSAAVDNLFQLVQRTEELARDVAERFDLDYEGLDVDLPAPELVLARIHGLDAKFDRPSMQQFLNAFTAARMTFGGLVMFGAFGSLLGLTLAAPIGLAVGLVVGRKLVGTERQRQAEYRRNQAKAELRRYIDEVAFVVGKDCRDAVRRTQRFLRDEFAARAQQVERSANLTIAAIREAAEAPEHERRQRTAVLDQQWQELDRFAAQMAARPERRSA